MSANPAPNREQAAQWNEGSGRTWVEMQAILDHVLAPFEPLIVDAAFPGETGRVLDIGCGAGATTLAMVRRLRPDGEAVGLDISAPLVAAAQARAAAEGLTNVSFLLGDAQVHPFDEGSFDAVISRFGVMFFDDPEAAFANIRRAARPGAKLAFVAWRSPQENPFMTAARRAAAPLLPDLPRPEPDAPGQFAFADGQRVRSMLAASGWSSVDVAPLDVSCELEESDLLTYVTRLGPVGAALRSADEQTRARVVPVVEQAFRPFVEDGVARFIAACWLVTARA